MKATVILATQWLLSGSFYVKQFFDLSLFCGYNVGTKYVRKGSIPFIAFYTSCVNLM